MDNWNNRGRGLSDKRERGTGVGIVKRRNTKPGLISELKEIEFYLYGDTPLNKTEYERLSRRRKRILKIQAGKDARWSIMKGRPGPPREHERVPYGIKKASLDILEELS